MPTILHGKNDLATTGRGRVEFKFPKDGVVERKFNGAPTVIATAETYNIDENPAMEYYLNSATITIGKVTKNGFDYECKYAQGQKGAAGWSSHHLLNWIAMEGS